MSDKSSARVQRALSAGVVSLAGAAAVFVLLGSAQSQEKSTKRFAPDLTAYCKKYFPNSRPLFSLARQQWVCARTAGNGAVHRNIAMDLACTETEASSRYIGRQGRTPFCERQ